MKDNGRTLEFGVLFGTFALIWTNIALPARADEVCPVCNRQQCTDQQIVVTDWETNSGQTVDCVRCAITLMARKYPWSRASMAVPGYEDTVSVTRTKDKWSADPADAIVVTALHASNDCAAVRVFASREGFRDWAKAHPAEVAASRKSIGLADYARELAATLTASVPVPTAKTLAAMPQSAAQTAVSVAPAWVQPAVVRVSEAGLMQGSPDGKFDGSAAVTRYQMAAIIDRVLQRLNESAQPADSRAAAEANTATRDAERTPAPNGPVQRLEAHPNASAEQAVLAVARGLTAAGMPQNEVKQAIAMTPQVSATEAAAPPDNIRLVDVPSTHWAHDAVMHAVGAGLLNGFPDGTFRGNEPMTRYEIAVVLSRLMDRYPVLAKTTESATAAAGQKWTCPMHPDYISDKPGTCPKCGMKLVPVTEESSAQTESSAATPAQTGAPAAHTVDLSALAERLQTQLKQAGLSDEQIAATLAPIRAEIKSRNQSGEANESESVKALHRAQDVLARMEAQLQQTEETSLPGPSAPSESGKVAPTDQTPTTGASQKVTLRAASKKPGTAAELKSARDTTTLLGPTGLLLVPNADVQTPGSAVAGLSHFKHDDNVTYVTAGIGHNAEVTANYVAGGLSNSITLNGKLQLWHSANNDARLAAGLMDALDSVDTTAYAAYTKDFALSLGALGTHPVSLTAGIGGGNLLHGLFGGLNAPLNDKLSLLTDVVDFGGNKSQWDLGLEYRFLDRVRGRISSIGGDLGLDLAYRTAF